MHYEKTLEIQSTIFNMCASPRSCGEIAQRLGFTPQRTIYHIRKLIAAHSMVVIKLGGRADTHSFRYQQNVGQHIAPVEPTEKTYISPIRKKSREQEVKESFLSGSAMRNVENLADKLKKQNELNRRKSGRTHVGISPVYQG